MNLKMKLSLYDSVLVVEAAYIQRFFAYKRNYARLFSIAV